MRIQFRSHLVLLMAIGLVVYAVASCADANQSVEKKPPQVPRGELKTATFAGGCFWCMEAPFDKIEGVFSTTSGYTGGRKANPTYKQVSSGGTGHTEAVQIGYDPTVVSYAQLLDVFWVNIDPTVSDRQFCDKGSQYRPGIFYHDEEQKTLANESQKHIEAVKGFSDPIVIEITALDRFYPAEEYHQDFYKKNPTHYKSYRFGCGRDRRLKQLWGKRADKH